MTEPMLAYIDATYSAYVEEGMELYHELVLDSECRYDFSLEPDEEDVDLNFYITDEDGNILYQDESKEPGAAAWFEPAEYGIYRVYVKSASGSTGYTLIIEEQDEEAQEEEA